MWYAARGINVVAGYDIDARSKFAYEYNNKAKFILKDVKEIDDTEIGNLYQLIPILKF